MSSRGRYARNGHRRRKLRKRLLAQAGVCPICGEPIDPSIPTPDPMSAEVDEILPVSLGGDELDPENCRLVHRHCNQERGNKMYYVAGVRRPRRPKRPTSSQDWLG